MSGTRSALLLLATLIVSMQFACAINSLWAHGEGIHMALPDNLTTCHNRMARDEAYSVTKPPLTVYLKLGSLEVVPGRGAVETLKATIQFNETWFDSKFASCMADGQYGPVLETYLDWMELSLTDFHSPRTQFEPGHFLVGQEVVTKISDKGYLKFHFQGNFEFGCVSQPSHYPYDTAHCHITVSSDPSHDFFDYRFGDVDYEEDISGSAEYKLSKVETSSEMTDLWKSTTGRKLDKIPRLLLDFQFARTSRYETPLFLGPAFLVLLSWAAFFVSGDLKKGAYWTLAILLVLIIYIALAYQTFPPARASKTVMGFFSGCVGLLFVQIWYLVLADALLGSRTAVVIMRNIVQKLRRSGPGTGGTIGMTAEPYSNFENGGDKKMEATGGAAVQLSSEAEAKRSRLPRQIGLMYNAVVFVLFLIFWYASA